VVSKKEMKKIAISMEKDFEKNINYFSELTKKQEQLSNRISNLRLFFALAAITGVVVLFAKGYKEFGLVLLVAAIVFFSFLVARHHRALDALKRAQCKVDVNQRYLDRISGDWTRFKTDGNQFEDVNHPYTNDLDIFGPKSLYQWLNLSNTYYGGEMLKDLLSNPTKEIDSIKKRQNAVRELAESFDFCQQLECEGRLSKGVGADPRKFLSELEGIEKPFKDSWTKSIFYLLPLFTVLTGVLFLLKFPIPPQVPLSLIITQLLITAGGYKKVTAVLNTVHTTKESIEALVHLSRTIEKESFKDKYLSRLRLKLFHNNEPASAQAKKLSKIAHAVDVRYSGLLYILLNSTLLWDYHCVFAMEKWKKDHGHSVKEWFQVVGAFEALSSLAVVERVNRNWTYPEFTTDRMNFIAAELGHPLIPQDRRVCNDFTIENNLCVITGSNMSGKTTLLRTLGVNLVLAYAGAPVTAEQLQTSLMDIFTSMRIEDDLNSGISTFYAELLRIKKIIDYSQTKKPMLFLIDEIFRGTNSRDRILGAQTVLRTLGKDWVIGLISTHDFELCELEKEGDINIKNYHFTESYVNNQIRFDYKIRPGRSETTNAKYLMKMVGIELPD